MKEKLTFEQTYAKLKEIIKDIQEWNVPLEQLIDKIKEAKELISYCESIIKKVEEEIEEI